MKRFSKGDMKVLAGLEGIFLAGWKGQLIVINTYSVFFKMAADYFQLISMFFARKRLIFRLHRHYHGKGNAGDFVTLPPRRNSGAANGCLPRFAPGLPSPAIGRPEAASGAPGLARSRQPQNLLL
jgi:hypothetical protein